MENAEYLRTYRQRIRDWVAEYKEARPCLDCGGYFKACQMQFDHLRDKKLNVSLASSLAQAKEEIAKCELVCANCHSLRTYNRKQYVPVTLGNDLKEKR
jgi:flagellar biosynthesis/type III secretory pathway ATPase